MVADTFRVVEYQVIEHEISRGHVHYFFLVGYSGELCDYEDDGEQAKK